jgi:molybdate transport system ATP-binding protein
VTGADLDARVVIRRSASFVVDLDLSIPAGTTAALLGPNGAGKSSVVAAIAGLQPIDAGRISLGGSVVDDPAGRVFVPPEERRVGVVFQDYLLFPHLTALDNVAFGLRSRGVSRDEARTRARDRMSRLGLGRLGDRRPADLSGGEAQRVALARALVTEPVALLLDEPLAALDVTTRTELRHVLAEMLDAFDGVRLFITHDPTEAFLLASEVHIIEGGSVTQSGTADDIRLHPRTQYAADLAGSNLIVGVAEFGVVRVGGVTLHLADASVVGPVLITVRPTSITLHRRRPEGSQRNSWSTTVERVERLESRVRVRTGGPLPLTVEVTEGARSELDLESGSPVWIAFKATELVVQPG